MFTRRRDASKIALAFTIDRLIERGFQLFDIQFRTEHTTRLGAVEVSRSEYLGRLKNALRSSVSFV
jgi:leucyl/phenylalanyl-tRNA--protein transferase